MANVVEILVRAKDKATAQLKKVGGAMGGLASAAQLGTIALGAATAAAYAAVKAYNAIIVPTIEYARTVREMSQALGIATDETSRIIQVADDFNVSIDELRVALQLAAKNGFAPTVENLAALSDQMAGIKDPTQRAAAMAKIFGRNWASINPVLSAGGAQIREMAAAVDEGLIVTQSASVETRRFELALDDLNDSAMAVRNTIGLGLIRAINDEIDAGTRQEDSLRRRTLAYQRLLKDGIQPNVAIVSAMARAIQADEQEVQRLLQTTQNVVTGMVAAVAALPTFKQFTYQVSMNADPDVTELARQMGWSLAKTIQFLMGGVGNVATGHTATTPGFVTQASQVNAAVAADQRAEAQATVRRGIQE
jgi:hypothetical protein